MLAKMHRDNGARKRRADAMDVAAGEYIRALRNEQGLTQTQLADQCGVTFQQLQKYENGTNRTSVSRFVSIAKALGMEPGKMLTEIMKDQS